MPGVLREKMIDCHSEPLLSVVVPVYNTDKYLDRCIKSILNQTYKNIQLVLVDDSSTDNSGAICDSYVSLYENVKCIHKEQNEGLAYARRDGSLNADGEYIAFVDSDDWIEQNMYEHMMKFVIEDGAEIVSSGAICEGTNGAKSIIIDPASPGVYSGESLCRFKENLVYDKKYHSGLCTVSLALKLYKKDLLLPAFEGIPKHMTYWEDLTYVFPPFFVSNKVAITDSCFYHIVYRSDSMSRRENDNILNDMVYSLGAALTVYEKYDTKILQCFYQKAIQVIAEYLWSIPTRNSSKADVLDKWMEVYHSEDVIGFDKLCNDKSDDKLFQYVMAGKLNTAYIYQKLYRAEKHVENRIKTIIGYKKC